jgi:hypothetical protein
MLKKWKLLFLTSTLVVAGFVGLAAAKGGGGGKAGMVKKFDENGDGKLDDAEEAKMKTVRGAMRAKREAAVLAKFDANKNGVLDPAEKKAMRAERAAERFKQLDKDGDGKLSLDEFQGGGMGKHHHRGHRGHGKL